MKKYFSRAKEEAEKKPVDVKKENQPFYDAVKNFEKNEIATVKGKAKLLTGICIVQLVIIGALGAGVAMLSPLKTAVPFLIRVDNSTGYSDVVPRLEDAKSSYEQVEKKYFLSKFVINYESYDWNTIQEMLDTVKVMAGNDVFSQYDNAIRAENSPLYVLKKNNKVRVKIKSVTLLQKDIAQVRFSKMVLDSDGKPSAGYRVTDWIATVSFDFDKKIKTEGQRLINPLGFQVSSYRVDPEAVK